MREKGVFNLQRNLPRMSWSPKNLFNLWCRTVGPKASTIKFRDTPVQSLYRQRWISKAVVRAYHGDFIPEKVFKRWFLPETLPDVRPQRAVKGNDAAELEEYARRKKRETDYQEEEEKKGMAPVGSLMFSELERRIDVLIFRCNFASSVYEARRLIIHGNVKLNGKKHINSNTRLAPGDMISVDPSAIRFFKRQPHSQKIEVQPGLTPFYLPYYASPWLFVPPYVEVNYATCSAVYVRHPTARPGYSEIPTPYDADGEVVRFAWEWYAQRRPRVRSRAQLSRMPEDRAYDPESINVEAERKRLRKEASRRFNLMSGVLR